MTSIYTWSPWIAIIVSGGPILLAALSLAYSLYLSHRHMDAIKEALKNSRYIYLWGPSLGKRGLIWSLWEISKIAGMVVWPRASIIIGELDPVDLKNFPPHLKRRLIVNMSMALTAFSWMIAVAIVLKFR
ncbi:MULTISPECIES: hypothetical protein [unclassified Pseudomonas]|uniref:hypothetical protein n=1 Tax=unclassified Pseudomonas TaxID=196821 RepID=UPI0020047092|nr:MULTISPECIES: hypothetical protein [unclassified Pseudomonas]MCK6191061.1 hypothetical protein [Pseudomonas sp. EYE_354]WLH69814.1 hypothetical protein PSH59_06745 [Pseudomonas sp. FP2309]